MANVYTQGVEIDAQYQLPEGFVVSGAYTYLDAKDKETDLQLIGRHPHQGFLKLSWFRPEIGLRGNIRGTMYSDWINSRSSGVDTIGKKFALFDFYLAKSLWKGFEVFGAVDNFMDNQDPNTNKLQPSGAPYSILRPEAGRTWKLGIRWELDRSN